MTTDTKNKNSIEQESARSSVAEKLPDEVVDRLAGLLPADELQDAIKGLAPEQITGPGGLLTKLAGRVIETALEPPRVRWRRWLLSLQTRL
jgi:hypothetical protein